MRRHLTLLLLLAAMILSACGTRGSLYLPPQASPQTAETPKPSSP